jgi:phytoene desaturase (3,4-didehydrolycopene-forming)
VTWLIGREKFNLDRGGILGLSHSFFNVLSFRPSTQHPTIDNCYFVGASTHPGKSRYDSSAPLLLFIFCSTIDANSPSGTGVPICLAGARVTAEQILSKAKRKAPWPRYNPDVRRPTASKLDVLQPTYNYSQIVITTLIVLISISIAAYRL